MQERFVANGRIARTHIPVRHFTRPRPPSAAATDAMATALMMAMRWPPVGASAAGRRTLELIGALSSAALPGGRLQSLVVATGVPTAMPEAEAFAAAVRALPAWKSDYAPALQLVQVSPDDFEGGAWGLAGSAAASPPTPFTDSVADLPLARPPDLVLYDTFIAEDVYGWRLRRRWAHHPLLQVLDTQDLHSMREARGIALAAHMRAGADGAADGWDGSFRKPLRFVTPGTGPFISAFSMPPGLAARIDAAARASLRGEPGAQPVPPAWQREVAAIARCQLTLVMSDVERDLLVGSPSESVPPAATGTGGEGVLVAAARDVAARIIRVPFIVPPPPSTPPPQAAVPRSGFVALGTFRHPPNNDSACVLRALWPRVAARLAAAAPGTTHARLDVWGSYCTPPWEAYLSGAAAAAVGYNVRGQLADLAALRSYRGLLAPLRFGAGLKGKVVDALEAGTPVITTSIGAEGFPRAAVDAAMIVADSDSEFIAATVALATDDDLWRRLHAGCTTALRALAADGAAAVDTLHAALAARAAAAPKPPSAWTAALDGDVSRLWMSRALQARRQLK